MEEMIGTGPFVFESYKSKDRTTLVRNDEYFMGKPMIEKIIYFYVPDMGSRELAFRRGELDAIYGASEKVWVDKMEKEGFVVDPMGPPDLKMLQFNMLRPPFNDIRVRGAIAHAIDRSAIVKFEGEKIAKVPLSPIPEGYYGRVTEGLPQYEYNPEKAKKLLSEAGYPNGFSIEMRITTLPVYLDKMTIIQAQLRKVGIDLKLKEIAHTVYHSHNKQDLNPMVLIGARRFPLAQIWLEQFHYGPSAILRPHAVHNYAHYEGIDGFIEKARIEMDREKQLALYREAQAKLMEDLPSYPIAESYIVYARAAYVDLGYKPISNLSEHYQVGTYTKILKH
jgi:peptide/nickel transport system substrate-binding protein